VVSTTPTLKQQNPGQYDPKSADFQAKYGPTAGNSFLQNAAIGAGKLYTDVGLGARQLYARAADAIDPQNRLGALQSEAADKATTDQPIMATGGGKVGAVAGALPLAFIPGAATLPGAAAIGGAQGLFTPTQAGDSLLKNTSEGVGMGALGYGAGNLLGKAAGSAYENAAAALGLRATSAEEVLANNAAASSQNMGAAAASPNLQNVSPEFKSAIVSAANKNAGAVNPEALARHVQAQSLPVKVDLMEGQALQNPTLMSNESNLRGAVPAIAKRVNEQNGQLAGNFQALRDEAGPEVFSTNATEHGDTLIQAYKDKDAAAQAVINDKYKALKDAAGGDFPVDGQAFVNNADAALKQNMKGEFLPPAIDRTLNSFRTGQQMTFENFENLRTSLAAASRTAERAGDGNAKAAISIVRDQLEALPMSEQTAQVRALADDARQAARERFQALREDPAYNAAVNDSVSPDRFVSRFVINGARDDVATMARNLGDNDTAKQTMAVATLDHLRDAAKIDPSGNGNFAQASFNKALNNLSPKLSSMVDSQTAEHLQNLGDVARYAKGQPAGSSFNNSNTLVGAMADYGGHVIEHGINAGAHGLPLGTALRLGIKGFSKAAEKNRILAPGAGLDRLDVLRAQIGKP
jgi:hypothetical protein